MLTFLDFVGANDVTLGSNPCFFMWYGSNPNGTGCL